MDRDFSVLQNGRPTSLASKLRLLALGMAAVAGPAGALGVGRPLTQSALGQPLNLLFPVRLGADEALTPDCVKVDLSAGDAHVPAGLVQVLLEGEGDSLVRAVRLQSAVPIDEPIVTVSLSLGCPARFTRQYTAFIDPPAARSPAGALAVVPPVPLPDSPAATDAAPRNYSPALRAALATADAKPSVLLAVANQPVIAPVAVPSPSSTPARNTNSNASTSHASEPAAAKPAHAAASKPAAPALVAAKTKPTARAKPAAKPANARLRLDAPEQIESVALAASGPAVAQAASQPELLLTLAQLEALGQSLSKVQQEQRATEARLLAMRAELEQAQARRDARDGWMRGVQYALGLTVLALAAGCFHLWRSRRRERTLRDQQWWAASQLAEAGEAALASADGSAARSSAPSKGPTPGLGPLLAPGTTAKPAASFGVAGMSEPVVPTSVTRPAPLETRPIPFGPDDEDLSDFGQGPVSELPPLPQPLPIPFNTGATPDRQVTVEELIDLEQQVDFFIVLGQDDAAIDLLQARIDSGHANALPYLKLLELHQRRGDASAFAALARRFSDRFGALAPTWGDNLNQGRPLEAYETVVQTLLSRWEDSSASMALLQNLLASGGSARDPGSEGDERGFDLPAYRDLLMLYSVARDRYEQDMRSDDIDLFLPFDETGTDSGAMLATMVWQAQPTLIIPSDELDISLDDAPVIKAPGVR